MVLVFGACVLYPDGIFPILGENNAFFPIGKKQQRYFSQLNWYRYRSQKGEKKSLLCLKFTRKFNLISFLIISHHVPKRREVRLFLFVWVKALCPSQQFSSNVETFSWVQPVLSNGDEVFCLRTQHRTPGEIGTCDLAIKG